MCGQGNFLWVALLDQKPERRKSHECGEDHSQLRKYLLQRTFSMGELLLDNFVFQLAVDMYGYLNLKITFEFTYYNPDYRNMLC